MNKYSKDAFTCPNPWLICHHVDTELVESYQAVGFYQGYRNAERCGEWDSGLYLEQRSLGWVQLSVALHLWMRVKVCLFLRLFCILKDQL